jgi:cell division septum initiation protein DivIVA
MSEDRFLKSEIERLNQVITLQEARITALEKEAAEFRQIETNLFGAISLANSQFRGILRAAEENS